ncbi:conserved hypothetical protein [Cupriavidus necator]|uniref:DUF4123 domain-containing protein n=1 Tax=Cupriavidus necator TaxID=106590 RepID=A0A1K0JFK8_CUPNE|nr:conserved hypothetical protein [Cupriavidus necator]
MEHVQDILERLRVLRDTQGFRHVFVIVDPLSASVPWQGWSDRIPPGKQWALRDPQMREPAFPCPKVLLLDEDADALLEETIRVGGAVDETGARQVRNPAVCGWLFARGIAADVPRHLVAAMQQRNAKFEPVLLRYYDPRVLPHLNRFLEADQRRKLLGPVEHWFALDRFCCLSDLQTQPPAPYVSPNLSLTAAQWTRIERLEGFNRSMLAYEQATGEPLPADREAEIDAAIARAAAQGIAALPEVMTFSLYSLIVHPEFDQHPAVAQAIAARERGSSLADALEQIPEQVWRELKDLGPEAGVA